MSKLSLVNIATEYFTMRGYKLKKDIGDEEFQSLTTRFDLIIHKGNEVHPVLIKDWNRTVGVNIVINVDKASQSAGFSTPILVAEKFSDHAKAYANRKGIKLITKSEMKREIKR
ncbi:MAG: restriction endonuclease [Candidatus Bathyarchaeia archaeon]